MEQIGLARRISRYIVAIGTIGSRPKDTDEEKLERRYLVYMGLLMACGGIIWGSLSAFYGYWLASAIPFGYVLLTILNFYYFHASRNFRPVRFVQILASLLLPFLFQWCLGGFVASGAVMLWAMVALLSTLASQGIKLGTAWLVVYLALTVMSSIFDGTANHLALPTSAGVTTALFIVNICLVSAIVFGLNVYLLTTRAAASARVSEMSRVLKRMFGCYLSVEVMNSIIEDPSTFELGGERRIVTIMMTDLRAFTSISERLEPEQVVLMLNTYFEVMVDLVLKYNGTINEIIGDALLVIFGAPQDLPDRARRAIACALEMQNAMDRVNTQNQRQGLPQLKMGIGINEADVIVGNIGSSRRRQYTVVGSGVNLASRIESYTVGGDVLISESVRHAAGEGLRIDGQREIFPKGAQTALQVYEVGGIGAPYNLALKGHDPALVTLVQEIPFRYAILQDKDVGQQCFVGTMTQLSRNAAVMRLSVPVDLLTNIKMNLEDVDEALAKRDIYGKAIGIANAEKGTWLVHFTSIPSEVDAYFQASLHYDGRISTD